VGLVRDLDSRFGEGYSCHARFLCSLFKNFIIEAIAYEFKWIERIVPFVSLMSKSIAFIILVFSGTALRTPCSIQPRQVAIGNWFVGKE
jgi:hypothetical protein